AYRERRDAMVAALDEHFPGTAVSGIAAGLHVIARLPARYAGSAEQSELDHDAVAWPLSR
ncbi:hypothetical protein, partial [Streptomyces sp. SP18CM02]|uniref:hypothetical protein n=1 Tax=Streptomyces sp. SP18CM02 TaxID=2758571 RepID=UPI001CC2890D